MSKATEDIDLYEKISEQAIKIHLEGMKIWEEKLSLYIRPKKAWMPKFVWVRLLNFLLLQTSERIT